MAPAAQKRASSQLKPLNSFVTAQVPQDQAGCYVRDGLLPAVPHAIVVPRIGGGPVAEDIVPAVPVERPGLGESGVRQASEDVSALFREEDRPVLAECHGAASARLRERIDGPCPGQQALEEPGSLEAQHLNPVAAYYGPAVLDALGIEVPAYDVVHVRVRAHRAAAVYADHRLEVLVQHYPGVHRGCGTVTVPVVAVRENDGGEPEGSVGRCRRPVRGGRGAVPAASCGVPSARASEGYSSLHELASAEQQAEER